MDQEREDYAESDRPPIGLSPAVVRLLAALLLMLALFGFCLLVSLQIDVD
jgi:hypothetical protein